MSDQRNTVTHDIEAKNYSNPTHRSEYNNTKLKKNAKNITSDRCYSY